MNEVVNVTITAEDLAEASLQCSRDLCSLTDSLRRPAIKMSEVASGCNKKGLSERHLGRYEMPMELLLSH